MARDALHILIRSHRYDVATALLAARIKAEVACPVTLVCDESQGPVQSGDLRKIAMTEADLRAWGWATIPADWGWFCGDACYYAAEAAEVDADYLLLIENDVFFQAGALAALVAFIAEGSADAGAAQLRRNDSAPKYSANLAKLGHDPRVGCTFPVSFVRHDLIAKMHDIRRASVAHGDLRVNDEAILAAAAHGDGVRPVDLATARPDLFPDATFQTNPPNLTEHFLAMDGIQNPQFAHPAISFAGVLERIWAREKASGRRRLRNILRQATPSQQAQILAALDDRERLNAAR